MHTPHTPHRPRSWRGRCALHHRCNETTVNKTAALEGPLALCFLVLLKEASKTISREVDFLAHWKFKQLPECR